MFATLICGMPKFLVNLKRMYTFFTILTIRTKKLYKKCCKYVNTFYYIIVFPSRFALMIKAEKYYYDLFMWWKFALMKIKKNTILMIEIKMNIFSSYLNE